MKWKGIKTFAVLGCIVVVAGGCAKQGVVKGEEQLAPQTTVKQNMQESAKTAPAAVPSVNQQPDNAATRETSPRQKLEPIPNAAELKAAMEKIYFNFDSYTLSAKARESLVKNSEIMKKYPAVFVRIEGNCDERGSDEYNLALGEKRAKEAMQYLKTVGIPAERLTVISYGKEKPLAPGHDETSWATNRRDDFVMLYK